MSEPLTNTQSPTPAQEGWADAEFGRLYEEHSRAIYYLALRFLSDPQKAEDATHDVFLKAFRKMDQFRGEASWRTWLYRIAINHCRNLRQSWHERHIATVPDDFDLNDRPGIVDSPLRALRSPARPPTLFAANFIAPVKLLPCSSKNPTLCRAIPRIRMKQDHETPDQTHFAATN